MAISVVLKDEAGVVLERMERPYIPLVGRADRAQYPLLGHVDPYGNTIFNRGQMDTLSAELQRVLDTSPELEEEQRAFVGELVDLCVRGRQRPHRYLWFVGD